MMSRGSLCDLSIASARSDGSHVGRRRARGLQEGDRTAGGPGPATASAAIFRRRDQDAPRQAAWGAQSRYPTRKARGVRPPALHRDTK
jgi:hypothetical protein